MYSIIKNEVLRMLSRNSRCPCGSGKRYKRCCMEKMIFSDGLLDELNKKLRNKIRHSQMWSEMVATVGETEAEKLLRQFTVIDAGSPVPEGNVVL